MSAFKVVMVIVFIFLLIAISTPINGSAVAPNRFDYRDCGNHIITPPGYTLNAIATRCGTTVETLRALNPSLVAVDANQVLPQTTRVELPKVAVLPVTGAVVQNVPAPQQVIVVNPATTVISVSAHTYLIQPGDTLFSLSQRFNTSINVLLQLNPNIQNPDLIYAGDTLIVP